MSTKIKQAVGAQHSQGGFQVPVKAHASKPNSGSIELANAPIPSRTFCADGFAVFFLLGQVRLAFFQRKTDGVSIRSMLELRFNKRAFITWVDNLPNADDLVEMDFSFLIKDFEEPAQSVAMEASFARSAYNEISSVIDFYLSSAASLNSHNKGYLNLQEVVSVQFPSAMFGSLLKSIKTLNI